MNPIQEPRPYRADQLIAPPAMIFSRLCERSTRLAGISVILELSRVP